MNTKLYQQIARTIEARLICIKSGNDYADKHEDTLNELNDLLPSGSGIDSGSKIDLDQSKPDRLVITFSYHHMNDGGYYDGWTDHTLIVTPSLSFGFDMRITGRDRNQTKEYLYDVYGSALREVVEFDASQGCHVLPSIRESSAQFQTQAV